MSKEKDLSVLNIMDLVLQVFSDSDLTFVSFGTNTTDNTMDDCDSLQDFDWDSDQWSTIGLRFLNKFQIFVVKVLQEPGKSITLMYNDMMFPVELKDFDFKSFSTKFKAEFIEKMFPKEPEKSTVSINRPFPNQTGSMIFNPFIRTPPPIDPLIPRPVVGARYDPIYPPIGREDLYGPLPYPPDYHRQQEQNQQFPGQFRHLPQFGPGGLGLPPDFNEFM